MGNENNQMKMTMNDGSSNRVNILVIAHPDDESMFFIPTVRSLISQGETCWLLCLTTGDFDGLGKIRSKEMKNAGHLLGFQKVIVRDNLKDHPTQRWDIKVAADEIGQALKECLQTSGPDTAIRLFTFDNIGVSGHVNHVDTYLSVQHLISNKSSTMSSSRNIEAWQLVSETHLLAKYFPFLEWMLLIASWVMPSKKHVPHNMRDDMIYRWHQPSLNWKAMATHASQFVWYRRLFVIFSCYTYVNRLRRMHNGDSGRR